MGEIDNPTSVEIHTFSAIYRVYTGLIPQPSMYGIFTYIYHKDQPNLGIYYTIHGRYGI